MRTGACPTRAAKTRAGIWEGLKGGEIKPESAAMNYQLSKSGALTDLPHRGLGRCCVPAAPCAVLLSARAHLKISPARMADAKKSPHVHADVSHIRFRAVQLRQGGCFENPLPLAQRRSAALARARASTAQGVGTHSQLPGRVWSVWSSKNESILASRAGARKTRATRVLREKDLIIGNIFDWNDD